MTSLNRSDDFNAYWSSYDPITFRDSYTYGRAKEWLHSRRSETNLLSGPTYGDFDKLMISLAQHLGQNQPILPRRGLTFGGAWETPLKRWSGTVVFDKISSVPRLVTIFQALSFYASDEAAKVEWRQRAPYYASDADTVRTAFMHFFRSGELPKTGVGGNRQ